MSPVVAQSGARSAAARDEAPAARGLARGTLGEIAARAGVAVGAVEQTRGAGRALDVAIGVEAGKPAAAARFATTRAVAALAVAARIAARTDHVARAGRASKRAAGTDAAFAVAVGADAAARGARRAIHVARRTVAGEVAVAARAATALAVAADGIAARVVAGADRVARRRRARQIAGLSFLADAVAAVTFIVVAARQRSGEQQTKQERGEAHV